MWKYSSFREKFAMIYVCAYPCQSTITVFSLATCNGWVRDTFPGGRRSASCLESRLSRLAAGGAGENWGEIGLLMCGFSFSIAQELRRSCSILFLDVDLLWDRCILMNEIKWRPMARGCLGKVIQTSENNPPSSSAKGPWPGKVTCNNCFSGLCNEGFPFC